MSLSDNGDLDGETRKLQQRLRRRLRALRAERRLTQEQVAAYVKSGRGPDSVSHSIISDYETGRKNPPVPALVGLAGALGIEVSELFLDGESLRHRIAIAALHCEESVLPAVAKLLDVEPPSDGN